MHVLHPLNATQRSKVKVTKSRHLPYVPFWLITQKSKIAESSDFMEMFLVQDTNATDDAGAG